MEVNVVAGHIDHDGGVFRNVDEFEIDTTITGGGKLLTGEREHLRGGFAVSDEGDELLVVLYALAIDGGKAAIIGELKADGIRRFIVVVLVTGGGAFRRLSRGIDGTRVLQFGQGGGKLGLEVGFRIVRVIGAVHVLQRVCCVEGDVIVLLPIALSGHDRRAARVVAPLGLTAGDRSLVLVTLSGTCHRFVAILGIPCRVALADKAALAICADVTLHITRRKAVDTGVGTANRKHGFPIVRTELRAETDGAPAEAGAVVLARGIRSFPRILQRPHDQFAVDHGKTFGLYRIRAINIILIADICLTVRVLTDVKVTTYVGCHTRILASHARSVAQRVRGWSALGTIRQAAFVRLGIVGGEEGSYCYGGHHGYRYGGGGQGAGTRKRATGCRSRSCIVSWCVADTITPLPHLVPYPQSVHPSEPLNSRVDILCIMILCIMPLSLLFYV